MENKHLSDRNLKPRKWLLYVLIIINIVIVVILANKIVTDRKNKEQEQNGGFDNIFNEFEDIMNNNNSFSDFDRKSFNSSFEMYVGTEWGLSVSRLIDEVITNNKTNNEHIITVVFENINSTDSNEIRNIKKSLDDWTEYEVILDYDENGFVNLITIER